MSQDEIEIRKKRRSGDGLADHRNGNMSREHE